VSDRSAMVEIVAAGNEVLLGDVLDTNTNWLCRRITALGGEMSRTVMVRDDVEVIAAEISAAVTRRPALIVTVGGLGPTSDDRTLAGVAAGTRRPLGLHSEAETMVRERYEEFAASGFVPFAEMNDARRKMAILPQGATPLLNSIGGAPGVLLQIGQTTIVSLPGVPEELKAIVDESCGELFARLFPAAHYEERIFALDLQDESAIAEILAAAEAAHPLVYIKSRAKLMADGHVISITLSARAADAAAVASLLDPIEQQVTAAVGAAGYAVRRTG